jgi:hypothetical protein
MYELSSSPEGNGLAHSQPVMLNRSYQHQLERRQAAGGDAKELKRLEKKEKKERKKMEKQLKRKEKKQTKEEEKKKKDKKLEKKNKKDKKRAEADVDSPFFVDSSSTPSFDRTQAQLLL